MASLRRTPSGSFVVCFRHDRRQYQRSLKTRDPKAAEALLGRVEHTLFQLAGGGETVPTGVDPGDYVVNGRTAPKPDRTAGPPPTFRGLVKPYLDEHRGRKAASSLRTERTHLRNLARTLGRKAESPVERFSKGDLDTALRQRFGQVGPTTVMKERQTLVSFVRWACGRQDVRLDASVAAYTGMRRGELLRLRWSDVDFRAGLVTARSRKQSRQRAETSRTIDLHPELAAILHDHRARRPQGQYVVCRAGSTAPLTVDMAHDHLRRTLRGTPWERPVTDEKSKVVVGFHTFRHSFASNLAAAGVDQRVIDAMMGHQTEQTMKRYRHLFPASRRAAVEALSFAIPEAHPER